MLQDYGGPLPELAVMHAEQRIELETEYREWLIDSGALKEAPKEKNNPSMRPPVKTFRNLEID